MLAARASTSITSEPATDTQPNRKRSRRLRQPSLRRRKLWQPTALIRGALQSVPLNSDLRCGLEIRELSDCFRDSEFRVFKQIVADGSYKALIAKWKLPETVSLFD